MARVQATRFGFPKEGISAERSAVRGDGRLAAGAMKATRIRVSGAKFAGRASVQTAMRREASANVVESGSMVLEMQKGALDKVIVKGMKMASYLFIIVGHPLWLKVCGRMHCRRIGMRLRPWPLTLLLLVLVAVLMFVMMVFVMSCASSNDNMHSFTSIYYTKIKLYIV